MTKQRALEWANYFFVATAVVVIINLFFSRLDDTNSVFDPVCSVLCFTGLVLWVLGRFILKGA